MQLNNDCLAKILSFAHASEDESTYMSTRVSLSWSLVSKQWRTAIRRPDVWSAVNVRVSTSSALYGIPPWLAACAREVTLMGVWKHVLQPLRVMPYFPLVHTLSVDVNPTSTSCAFMLIAHCPAVVDLVIQPMAHHMNFEAKDELCAYALMMDAIDTLTCLASITFTRFTYECPSMFLHRLSNTTCARKLKHVTVDIQACNKRDVVAFLNTVYAEVEQLVLTNDHRGGLVQHEPHVDWSRFTHLHTLHIDVCLLVTLAEGEYVDYVSLWADADTPIHRTLVCLELYSSMECKDENMFNVTYDAMCRMTHLQRLHLPWYAEDMSCLIHFFKTSSVSHLVVDWATLGESNAEDLFPFLPCLRELHSFEMTCIQEPLSNEKFSRLYECAKLTSLVLHQAYFDFDVIRAVEAHIPQLQRFELDRCGITHVQHGRAAKRPRLV
jgi:hypothetical protein